MTLEHIRIEFRCAEGALRRTLGVVEARGFSVRSMQMGSDGDAGVMTLALAPLDPTRKVERLLRQLERRLGVDRAPIVHEVHRELRRQLHRAAGGLLPVGVQRAEHAEHVWVRRNLTLNTPPPTAHARLGPILALQGLSRPRQFAPVSCPRGTRGHLTR